MGGGAGIYCTQYWVHFLIHTFPLFILYTYCYYYRLILSGIVRVWWSPDVLPVRTVPDCLVLLEFAHAIYIYIDTSVCLYCVVPVHACGVYAIYYNAMHPSTCIYTHTDTFCKHMVAFKEVLRIFTYVYFSIVDFINLHIATKWLIVWYWQSLRIQSLHWHRCTCIVCGPCACAHHSHQVCLYSVVLGHACVCIWHPLHIPSSTHQAVYVDMQADIWVWRAWSANDVQVCMQPTHRLLQIVQEMKIK